MVTYTMAKELNISPLDTYNMPASLVMELLEIHMQVEAYKVEEFEKQQKKMR